MTTTQAAASTSILDDVRRITPTLRANARAGEEQRWILDQNVELLDEAGVWRMSVPTRFGGLDLPLAQQVEVLKSAYAVELARQAVEVLYTASGASVIASEVPFQRFYRDMQALSIHAGMALNSNLEVQGRVLVGLDPGTPLV